jgi:hypothetical protein
VPDDVTRTPDDVANAGANHWSSWDDPDIEVQMHVDGHYGAFRHVRKSTGEVVSFGQICYSAEHFQKLKAAPIDVDAILASLPEELMDPGEDRWGGANLDWSPYQEKPHSPSP